MALGLNGDGSITGGTFNRPAFRAELSSTQDISNDTFTIIQFDNDSSGRNFDTNNCYSTSTYRFTPDVAGYYFVHVQATMSSASRPNLEDAELRLNRNGTIIGKAEIDPSDSLEMGAVTTAVTALVYMNGTSDYIDAEASIDKQTSTAEIEGDSHFTFLQAFKLSI